MDNNALKEQYTNLAKAASSSLNSYVYETIDAAEHAKIKFEDIIISGNSLDDGVLSECKTLLHDIADELKVIINSCDAKITSIVQEQAASNEDKFGETENSSKNNETRSAAPKNGSINKGRKKGDGIKEESDSNL